MTQTPPNYLKIKARILDAYFDNCGAWANIIIDECDNDALVDKKVKVFIPPDILYITMSFRSTPIEYNGYMTLRGSKDGGVYALTRYRSMG